jgi:Kef-type K+ transport system membrane component KefB
VGDLTLLTGLLGLLLVAGILVRMGAERTSIPSLVWFILLGFLLRTLEFHTGALPAGTSSLLDFLSAVGVVFLLFGVGLTVDIRALYSTLPRAAGIWIGNVLASAALGFLAARHLLNAALLPSVLVAVALTATSVGVTVAVWDEMDALGSDEGEILLDVAEMDDISAVILMAVLFALLPTLQASGQATSLATAAGTVGLILLKGLGFGFFCLIFANKAEGRITGFLSREGEANRILVVSGIGLVIASLADALGFSLAIGAFFAGMVFSVDPERIREEGSFQALHGFFVPFFFLGIGFQVDPGALGGALGPAVILLVAAILGKILGVLLPALPILPTGSALLLGVSMIPRAEIAMIVMERGMAEGEGLVDPGLFGAMVLVALVTCLVSPALVGWGLSRNPHITTSER